MTTYRVHLGGAQGPRGPQGKSAYEVAVDNGYTGTEAEFAEEATGAVEALAAIQAQEATSVAAVASAVITEDGVITTIYENSITHGDFLAGTPDFRTALGTFSHAVVALDSDQPELLARGYKNAFQWGSTNNYCQFDNETALDGLYYLAGFEQWIESGATLISETSVVTNTQAAVGSGTATTNTQTGAGAVTLLASRHNIIYEWGRVSVGQTNPVFGVGSTATPSPAGSRYIPLFFAFMKSSAWTTDEITAAIGQIQRQAVNRASASRVATREASDALLAAGSGTLYLAGSGDTLCTVTTKTFDGADVIHAFTPFKDATADLTDPATFDLRKCTLDGTLLWDVADDGPPDHITLDTGEGQVTIGADHTFTGGNCTTSANHGLDDTDVGSLWSSGGVQIQILGIIDANQFYACKTASNAAPTTGAYTHDSGAAHTTGFTISSVTSNSTTGWSPRHADDTLEVYIDGKKTDATTGSVSFFDNVQFVERNLISSRQASLADIRTQGAGWVGNLESSPTYARLQAYTYHVNGAITVHGSFRAYQAATLTDIMALQVGEPSVSGSFIDCDWVIPHSTAFTHDAVTYDFRTPTDSSVIENWSTQDFYFTPDYWDDADEPVDLLIKLSGSTNGGQGMAYGIADVPAADVSEFSLNLRNTNKAYFRRVDKGAVTLAAGDYWSWIAYRVPFIRDANRDFQFVVPCGGYDLFIVGWSRDGSDAVPVPANLQGREYEILRSKNVTVIGASGGAGTMSAVLDCDLTASATYAWLRIKVLK